MQRRQIAELLSFLEGNLTKLINPPSYVVGGGGVEKTCTPIEDGVVAPAVGKSQKTRDTGLRRPHFDQLGKVVQRPTEIRL